jgi:hypothetical protein
MDKERLQELIETIAGWRQNALNAAAICDTSTFAGITEWQHCTGRAEAYLNVIEELETI